MHLVPSSYYNFAEKLKAVVSEIWQKLAQCEGVAYGHPNIL